MTQANQTMDTTGAPMGCERFEELLPDYLEHSLPPAAAATAEAHRLACAACAALAGDLEAIRDTAADLPVLGPAADLWSTIEARIAAPVVAIEDARVVHAMRGADGGPSSRAPRGVTGWIRRPWLAAAAALLLVAGTAGVTYTLTAGHAEDHGALASDGVAPSASTPSTLAPVVAAAPGRDAAPTTATITPTPPTSGRAPAGAAGGGAPGATLAAAGAPTTGSALDAAAIYDREIAILRGLLDQRRSALDTSTVRVLETNLGIIDRAIQESREALMRDPASQLLNRQLTDVMGEKLELMRTAVLVSSGAD